MSGEEAKVRGSMLDSGFREQFKAHVKSLMPSTFAVSYSEELSDWEVEYDGRWVRIGKLAWLDLQQQHGDQDVGGHNLN